MINGISFIVPSRGRPESLFRLIESAIKTANNPKALQFCIGLDADDPEYIIYKDKIRQYKPVFNISAHIAYARTTSPMHTNTLCKHAATNDLLLFTGDDTVFRTQDWDAILYNMWNAYIDNIFVGYFNNGQDRKKCEHFVLHKKWLEIVGGEICPADLFQHFCIDTWVEDIAMRLGRLHYFQSITVEHMHPKYGKAARDDTYKHIRRLVNYEGAVMSVAERDTLVFASKDSISLRETQIELLQSHIEFCRTNGA